MADLLKKQIRDRVKANLTGLDTTGANIFVGRIYPVEESKLPCLLIYDHQENIEIGTVSVAGSRTMLSELEILVEGYAQSSSGELLENILCDIQKEVLIALSADPDLNNLVMDCQFSNSEISLSAEGKKPTGSNKLTLLVNYAYAENRPDIAVGHE